MILQDPENRAPEATFQNLMQLKVSGIKSLTFGLVGKQPGAEQSQQPKGHYSTLLLKKSAAAKWSD